MAARGNGGILEREDGFYWVRIAGPGIDTQWMMAHWNCGVWLTLDGPLRPTEVIEIGPRQFSPAGRPIGLRPGLPKNITPPRLDEFLAARIDRAKRMLAEIEAEYQAINRVPASETRAAIARFAGRASAQAFLAAKVLDGAEDTVLLRGRSCGAR